MLLRHIRQHNKHLTIATVIGFVLFTVAITRLPVGIGHGRELVLGLFQIGVLVAFSSVLWKINKYVSLFAVLAIIASVVPTFTLESQRALRIVLFGLGWYYIVYYYSDNEFMMDVICVIAFAHFMATCVQFFKIPSVWSGGVCGLMFNSNEGSGLFALCFPAFLREGRRIYLPMTVVGLLMIGSFGGMLAVASGTVFYGIMFGYYWIFVPVVVGIIAFLFIDVPTFLERWVLWKKTVTMLFTHRLISVDGKECTIPFSWKWGCGLGHWETYSRKLVELNFHLVKGSNWTWVRLHNTFVNCFVEMGIGFVIIVLVYIGDLFRKYVKTSIIPFTALIVIIVCCSTNSMFRMNAVSGMIAITWLSILEKGLHND